MTQQFPEFRFRSTLFPLTVTVLIASVLAGCSGSDPRVAVNGMVTVDGKPLSRGTITFAASRPGAPVSVSEIVDGKYSVSKSDGPWPGQTTVRIMAFRPKASVSSAPQATPLHMSAPPSPGGSQKQADEQEQYLPSKFNTDSKLEVSLVSGNNDKVDLKLDTK